MRITHIDYTKVFIPWQASMRDAMARWRASTNTTPEEEDAYVIVQMHTDAGFVGLGEGGRDLAATRAEGEQFIGKNPVKCKPHSYGRPWAHALLDVICQRLNFPLWRWFYEASKDYDLLTFDQQRQPKKFRDEVPVAYWSPYLPPDETAKHAEEGRTRGFKVHKIKARPWDAVEQVKAIASAAGKDYAVRLDPNELFKTMDATLEIDRALEGYNVECFEDPVPKKKLDWFCQLRERCHTRIALHSGNPQVVKNAIAAEAMDYVNIGGLPHKVFRAASLAHHAGLPVWLQNEGHCYDIQAAFDAHLGCILPNATLPFDTLHFLREGTIVENPLTPVNGHIRVPDGPGLGVKLDMKMVERYRVG